MGTVVKANKLVRQALADSDSADPQDVVEEIMASLDSVQKEMVLRELLMWFASTQAATERKTLTHATTKQGKSKWNGVRTVLDRREAVNGERKFLGDCTVDDLKWLSEQRFSISDSYRIQGEAYKKLAKRMVQAHVKTVKQLDEATVLAALEAVNYE